MRDVAARLAAGAARWDRAGIIVSAACAIHCTVLPLLTGLLPLVGFRQFGNERVEWAFIATAAVVGLVSHTRAYAWHHKHVAPGLLFATGLLLILTMRASHFDGLADPVCAAIAGVFTITAHLLNLRLCRCCSSCADHVYRERRDV